MTGELTTRLLSAAAQGSIFFLAVWIVCTAFKRLSATWKCWLWRVVPIKFLLALGLFVAIPVTLPSLPRLAHSNPLASTPPSSKAASESSPAKISRPQAGAVIAVAAPVPTSLSAATKAVNALNRVASVIWFLGVLLVFGRDLYAWYGVKKLIRGSTDAELSEARELFGIGGSVVGLRMRTIQYLDAPALIGLLKPTVLLPSDYRDRSPDALSSALAHELAHLKRRDLPWILIGEAAKIIFWFVPFTWLACREQLTESEIAADQLARTWTEKSPRDYATNLLEWIDAPHEALKPVRSVPGLLLSTHQFSRRINAMSLNRYSFRSNVLLGSLLCVPFTIGMASLTPTWKSSSGLAGSSWPSFHGGPTNTGFANCPTLEGVQKWAFKSKDRFGAGPAIGADGTVYVGSQDKTFYALSGVDGTQKWSFKGTEGFCTTPAIGSDGTVYVGDIPVDPNGWNALHKPPYDSAFYAFDGKTGAIKWKFSDGPGFLGSPTIGPDGTVYVTSLDQHLYAFDGQSGKVKWSLFTHDETQSTPAVGPDGTVYLECQNLDVYALDGQTGAKKWTFKTGKSKNEWGNLCSPAIGADGTLYLGGVDGILYALDSATGTKKWGYQTSAGIHSTPAIGADGSVYFGDWDGCVYAIDGKTGDKKWVRQTSMPIDSSLAIGSDGSVYLGSKDKCLYAFDAATGLQRWAFKTSGLMGDPTLDSNGTVYVGDINRHVYAVK